MEYILGGAVTTIFISNRKLFFKKKDYTYCFSMKLYYFSFISYLYKPVNKLLKEKVPV